MRAIIAISMPAKKRDELKNSAKKAKKSVSGYVLEMFELMKQFISEDDLLEMTKKAEINYKKGKTKELKSLADLMKGTS